MSQRFSKCYKIVISNTVIEMAFNKKGALLYYFC